VFRCFFPVALFDLVKKAIDTLWRVDHVFIVFHVFIVTPAHGHVINLFDSGSSGSPSWRVAAKLGARAAGDDSEAA
jgi:hypothetical protein